jgi:hypothetical protein
VLSRKQQNVYNGIIRLLDDINFERRALGRGDYPTDLPLKDVHR